MSTGGGRPERPPEAAPAPDEERVVCEVARRGRLLVGEPFFEPGLPLTLGRRGAIEAQEGELVAVRPLRQGRAALEEVLGRPDDVRAVLAGLAVEAGARRPFSADVEDELAALAPAEAPRRDLRELLTFTVDPTGARDFDDALSFVREPAGVRAFVHVADVAAFVPPGGAVDLEAERRATSVYLPGRVEPMLPARLSDDLCSLVAGEERLAVTTELGPDGAALVYRSTIASDRRLSYPEAEEILAGARDAPPALREALETAQAYAAELRRRRFARGALALETRELEFTFADGRVTEARAVAEPAAHSLVEELMILANERVAELLAAARRQALFRVHERPEPDAIERLTARFAALDVPTPPMPELHAPLEAARYAARLAEWMARYARQSGRGRAAFPSMVLRTLRQARYDPANLGHSGLASPAYCHFTSPIRRYPDLVCHRALLAHLGLGSERPYEPDELRALAMHASEAERDAAALERRGDDVCLAFLLEQVLFDQGWSAAFDGEVVGLVEGGAFVRFAETFEGYVRARALAPEPFDIDPLATMLVGRRSGRRLRLGDPLRVSVRRVERATGRVELTPL